MPHQGGGDGRKGSPYFGISLHCQVHQDYDDGDGDDDDDDYSVLVFICKHGNEGMGLVGKRQATKLVSFITRGGNTRNDKNYRNCG